jgi:hypothetical protein
MASFRDVFFCEAELNPDGGQPVDRCAPHMAARKAPAVVLAKHVREQPHSHYYS